MEYSKNMNIVSENLFYDYLTMDGQIELDFILMYLNQNMGVQRIQFLGALANILFIYMPPSEVF